ncbi:uncharacterized protein LOC127519749 isoform X4 [Ctenopharyngodon idella]|uniref:uncharacterized protein LOC127519749 isoform X4 n=1 Tax=Ctenopharyngodon idella TaxID=7959 RepID=UPI002231193C|nr:uncharacterized protein LOC127519749 isoform X4 [Ctenopharyngodon idella]
MVKEKTFVFFCLCFCHLVGVFGDELKSVSVMEGDSVTLQINVTEIQRNYLIKWTFGTNRSLIAKITVLTIDIPGNLDERFRGKLKLDNQTGSLTITNTRAEHAGVYEVEISRRSSSSKHRFNVTVNGVFGDELKSVMEGDSVTLQTNVTEIQKDDLIKWTFGTNRSLIAKIIGEASDIPGNLDERFRGKLKLDKKTGSLTITNITTEHAGVYEVEISRRSSSSKYRFNVTVNGVFGDELKSVSVMEGDSVTLQTNVDEIQKDDLIKWTFGTNRSLIARIIGETSDIPGNLDERFRGKLKLDKKTGSLIITNTRTEHAGVYEVEISRRSSSYKHRFTVTVNGVFGDELKSVSVMEGDSVTLQTNVDEIQKDDLIKWTFGTNRTLIARIIGETSDIPGNLDERFRGKLKLDKKTGSLIITNITTEHAGVYEVEISRRSSSYKHRFTVTVNGVFGDELKSVMEGESVLLQINVDEIQRNDLIKWTFGTNRTLIAKIVGETSDIPGNLDERFRGKLKLDKKTGSLIITNTRTEHDGVYEVEINRRSSSYKYRFTVTVNELHGHYCDSVEAVL